MKSKLVPELASVAIIGIAYGLIENHFHQKWHRLGRDAFLARESQYFERLYAGQVSFLREILIWTIVALIVYSVYKGLALLITKILD